MQLLDDTVYSTTELEARQTEITARMEETVAFMKQLINENASAAHDPDKYVPRWHQLEQCCQQQEQEHQKLCDQIADLTTRRAQAAAVRDYLATRPPLEYSDEAWNTLIKQVVVDAEGSISINFKDQA